MHKCIALLQVLYDSTYFGRMRPSSGVIVFATAAKWCSVSTKGKTGVCVLLRGTPFENVG
jgi:hypothetical protein